MAERTLLRAVLEQRGWASWPVFEMHFSDAARRVAERTAAVPMSISQATFKRWLSGERDPRSLAGVVLEEMLGVETELLFRPAPSHDVVLPRPLGITSRAAALALDARWGNSLLFPSSPAAGVDGSWRMEGLGLFDGTSVAVQAYEAIALPDDLVGIGPDDYPHLRAFVQPLRRALVLGSLGAGQGTGLFAVDAAHVRRQLVAERPVDVLPIPAAYRLDDLTYGLIWAFTNLDDGLSADDAALRSGAADLDTQLARPLSAVARAAFPGLSAVGALWLGSRHCARHTIRRLRRPVDTWALWHRDCRGEEAAAWLFFRHQHDVVRTVLDHLADGRTPLGSAFCVPAAAVKDSPAFERILLFLAIAWLESCGVPAWVCAEPEYAQVDGFLLVPGQRAVVTNWLRTPDVCQVDVTDRKAQLRDYADAVGHARAHTVAAGDTPAARLRALADHLELDWSWVTRRCRELSEYGLVDMLRPRSRLLTLSQADSVLAFLGKLDADD
ncbi:hypothetical protein [Cryptosporangium aurantiacum]|uniref:Uncharacterized protein n=1 Tax=Cryptosporangium aurantiacum TaxID=134849 RepID=A0A1M7TVI7_9ACTN|nr:hypothetical protein [Cryptosporangium aurantiacum]SHN74633.1 hypothetical protein SAMN05443668_107120 [Cryptosporangium aurantiacum]